MAPVLGDQMAPSDDDRPFRTLAADAFLGSVEAEAGREGTAPPGIHHWVVAACSHPFLVRTIAPDVDTDALGALAAERLAAGDRGVTVSTSEVIDLAARCAQDRGDQRIRPWHVCHAVLERAGVTSALWRAELTELPAAAPQAVPRPPAVPAPPPVVPVAIGPLVSVPATPRKRPSLPLPAERRATPTLDHAGRDLTALARSGALPPIVGRDAELDRMVEILCRPSKPNPLLVGEPGTGKTALVEGLAARIVAGTVPDRLCDRRVIAIDIMWLVQDSGTYGRLEQRLTALLDEARATRAILFADELATLLGAGGREQKSDVASLIKPVLARGDIPFISATTDDEYRRHIQADDALDRRFLVLRIQEPFGDVLATIVETVARRMAAHEGITIDGDAIRAIPDIAAVRLPDRREPDRSVEVVEQAIAVAVAVSASSIDRRAIELAVRRGVGAHEPTAAALVALEEDLGREGILAPEDAGALVARLATACAGVSLRPERPRAVVLLLAGAEASRGSELASAIASAFLGSPERVITIDVGALTGPSAVPGLLGTQQGYVGYQSMLPIHGLLQTPHSVVRFIGLDTCDPTVRAVIAQGLRHGALVDGSGRRIGLASTVMVLEASMASATTSGLGFRPPGRPVESGVTPPSPQWRVAAAIGRELADEVDLVIEPPAWGRAAPLVEGVLRRLVRRYEAMGSGLSWDVEVEGELRDACSMVGADRERERLVEDRVARAVRHLLGRLSEVACVHLSVEGGSLRAVALQAATEDGSGA